MIVDGSQGEGGGQVLRTCLSLAALTGEPVELLNIRAGRSRPGLRPQHLAAVRALAAICGAELAGDRLESRVLSFRPSHPPRGGEVRIDVAAVTPGRSAGATTLIAQALLWPLLFASEPSTVVLRGGTFVPHSPPYHYLAEVALPAFARLGARCAASLGAWGWMQAGQGEMTLTVEPIDRLTGFDFVAERPTSPTVHGVAAVSNLPAHIPQRMANRVARLLVERGCRAAVTARRESGAGPGAGICLWLPGAGASALGRPGLPAERVAEAAVASLWEFLDNPEAAVDEHLADQLILSMALAHGTSRLTTSRLTRHALTVADLARQLLGTTPRIEGEAGGPATIEIAGIGFSAGGAGA